ncbi:MAG: DUF167 domain-containing protein [Candidatus Acidiferrales bacterium]
MIEVAQRGDAVVFAVRVQPRASRDEISGERAGAAGEPGALKVRLTAPPVDDRANAALCRLLADALGAAVSAVRIVSGDRSRMKWVEVRGVTVEQVRALVKMSKR